jgi:hypothetical protein
MNNLIKIISVAISFLFTNAFAVQNDNVCITNNSGKTLRVCHIIYANTVCRYIPNNNTAAYFPISKPYNGKFECFGISYKQENDKYISISLPGGTHVKHGSTLIITTDKNQFKFSYNNPVCNDSPDPDIPSPPLETN